MQAGKADKQIPTHATGDTAHADSTQRCMHATLSLNVSLSLTHSSYKFGMQLVQLQQVLQNSQKEGPTKPTMHVDHRGRGYL
jgi:hypothetical protein